MSSSTRPQRPIMIIDNSANVENEEDCYESIDEDENDLDSTPEKVDLCSRGDDSAPSTSSDKLECSVCKRGHSEKYLLFKWPSDKKTRLAWAVALDMLESSIGEDALICAFHFPSSHFSHVDGRVYWEKGAFPRYKNQRPKQESPFPWEKNNNGTLAEKAATRPDNGKTVADHRNFLVSYRRSFYKNKNKTAHEVAIISKLDANIYLEFSYNRTSQIDGSKFYTCLGCRRAKVESQVKDVIRTVHIDGTVILSKGDPFYGHHYACLPYTNDQDVKSYRPVVPQPMHMDMSVVYGPSEEDMMYIEEDSHQPVWTTDSGGIINIEHVPFYGHVQPVIEQAERTEKSLEDSIACTMPSYFSSINRRKRPRPISGGMSIPKCHLCSLVVDSTQKLIEHLQMHMERRPTCRKCSKRIPPEEKKGRICGSCRRAKSTN